MSIPFSQSTQGLLIDSRLDALEATDTANAQVLTNLAKPINEAANSRLQVVPDLPLVRKMAIGSGGVPTGAQRAAATVNLVTSGSSTITLQFAAAHGFRVNELINPTTTVSVVDSNGITVSLGYPLRVLTVPDTTHITARLEFGQVFATASAANAAWAAVTRGDDTGVTGDLMSGDDTGAWNKNATLRVWREDDPTLLALFPTEKPDFVWLCQKGSSNAEGLSWYPNQTGLNSYLGQKRGFGAAVVPLTSGVTVTAAVFDGGSPTYGDVCSVVGQRKFIAHIRSVVNGTVGLYAESLQASGSSGAFFVVAGLTRFHGRKPQDGDFSACIGFIRPQGSITFGTINGASVTFPAATDLNGYYSYTIDSYQASSGRVGPDVKVLHWNLEGISQVWGTLLGSRERIGNPTTFGHVCTANGHTLGGPVSPVTVTRSFSAGVVTITITTTDPHGAINGQPCEIRGLSPVAYNVKGNFLRNSDTVLTYQFAAASDPGAITGTAYLLVSHYDASRCELNLSQGSFALYSVTPSARWDFVSMDTSRLVA